MLALDFYQEDSPDQPFNRREVVELLGYLHAVYSVTLALVDGRILATPEKPPLSDQAREFIRDHKDTFLTYLTTPPDDMRPCPRCERAGQWALDWMAIWVCDCCVHPEHRQPAPAAAAGGGVDQARTIAQYWQASGPVSPDEHEKEDQPGQLLQETPGPADQSESDVLTARPGHGFLTPSGLLVNGQLLSLEMLPTTSEMFLDLALDHDLTHLWVMPAVDIPALSGEIDEDGKEKIFTETHDILLNRKRTGTKAVASLVGRRRKPHTTNTRVIFLEETPWPQTLAPLQGAIEEVETGLRVEMQASPTSVGLRYLEKVDSRYYKRYFEKVENIDWSSARDDFKAAAHSLIWHRKPGPAEAGRRFVVAYDKRSAFPRAAKEEAFGIGQPVHQERPAFNHLAPGIWYCRVSDLEKIDTCLPAPLWETWHNPGWLSTQIVKLLKKMGASVEIAEAVIWEEKKNRAPIFERWASDLWEFRHKSQYPDAAKAILNNPLGFTINGDDQEDSTFRPDWHMTIVGSTRAALIYNAMTIAKETGLYPIGAYIDALYYCSDTPTIPGYLEKHPDSLGGYSHKWTLALDQPIGNAREGVHGADCLPTDATVLTVLQSPMAWNYQLQIFNRIAEEVK